MTSTSTRILFAAFLACAISTVSTIAQAGLNGQTITATWEYAPSGYVSTNSFVVGSGIELPGNFGLASTLDVGDAYILITPDPVLASYSEGVTWTFSDLSFGSAFSVSVMTADVEGFYVGDVQVGANFITWTASESVSLLEGSPAIRLQLQAVPEPSTALLFAGGALLLYGYRSQRAKRS